VVVDYSSSRDFLNVLDLWKRTVLLRIFFIVLITLCLLQIKFTRKSQNCNAPKKTYICNYTFIFVEMLHVNWKFKSACSFYTLYCLIQKFSVENWHMQFMQIAFGGKKRVNNMYRNQQIKSNKAQGCMSQSGKSLNFLPSLHSCYSWMGHCSQDEQICARLLSPDNAQEIISIKPTSFYIYAY